MQLKSFFLKKIIPKKIEPFESLHTSDFIFLRDDGIGDLLIMLPFLFTIKKKFPSSQIMLIVGERNKGLVQHLTGVDVVINTQNMLTLGLKVKRKKTEVVLFDFFYRRWSQMCLLYFSLRPIRILGFKKQAKNGLDHANIKNFVSPYELNNKITFFENYRIFLEEILETPVSKEKYLSYFDFPFPFDITNRMAALFDKFHNKETVFINLEGSDIYRKFPVALVQNLINQLSKQENFNFLFSASPSYLQKVKRQTVVKGKNIYFLDDSLTILDVLEAVRRSELIVSVDTSIIHMASLYNKKTVGVYIKERHVDNLFFPYSDEYIVLFSSFLDSLSSSDVIELAVYIVFNIIKKMSK